MKGDKIGLIFVAASLLAISVILALVFEEQQDNRVASIRTQGISLTRALSAIEYGDLTPGGEQSGVMQVLRHGASMRDFAYVSIADTAGLVVNEVTADGIFVPPRMLTLEPTAWRGETKLQAAAGSREIIEFHAPLLEGGELSGFVRLGFFYPEYGPSASQLPYVAMVALAVFLLVPLFYFLVRLEVRPIQKMNEEIGRVMEGEGFRRLDVVATGELGDFMRRFNRFAERACSQIDALEAEQQNLITSSKLLSYKKSRVETALETLPDAVLILDETGAISYANAKLGTLFGTDPETIVNGSPEEWCDQPGIIGLLSEHYGKRRTLADTVRFEPRHATERAIATKTYPLFSPRSPSQTIGTLIVFRDETQESASRKARTEFVGHLAHELKSPLNVLALYSESLSGDAANDESFRVEAANVISSEVSRLNGLIKGLLNLTQIETGGLQPDRSLVRIRDLASDAFEDARRLTGDANIKFTFTAPKEVDPILIDKDLIRIALDNLLSNAVKYNSDAGQVELTLVETEDAVQIRVADTGIGIGDADIGRIFDKFFRADSDDVREKNGHGLGLALTKEIVELHRGTLMVDRDREVGTEFVINLWKDSADVRQVI